MKICIDKYRPTAVTSYLIVRNHFRRFVPPSPPNLCAWRLRVCVVPGGRIFRSDISCRFSSRLQPLRNGFRGSHTGSLPQPCRGAGACAELLGALDRSFSFVFSSFQLSTFDFQPPLSSKSFICHTCEISPVSPIIATDPKTPLRKSFVCHTCETPQGVHLNVQTFKHSNSQRIRRSIPSFSSSCALFHFPYGVSPLFATLTKTAGVYTLSSHFGTLEVTYRGAPHPCRSPCGTRAEILLYSVDCQLSTVNLSLLVTCCCCFTIRGRR